MDHSWPLFRLFHLDHSHLDHSHLDCFHLDYSHSNCSFVDCSQPLFGLLHSNCSWLLFGLIHSDYSRLLFKFLYSDCLLLLTIKTYYIAHASLNVTSYKYLFIYEKQPQSTNYQALFGQSNSLSAGKSAIWTRSFKVAR